MINEYGGEDCWKIIIDKHKSKQYKTNGNYMSLQLFEICRIFTENNLIHCDIKFNNIYTMKNIIK